MNDPSWLEEAAKAAHDAAGLHDESTDWWLQYAEGEREEWRRAVRAVRSTEFSQPPTEKEIKIALTTFDTFAGGNREDAMRAALIAAYKTKALQ